ncbi:IclR family transcriptional regulator [Pararhodobacter marinus]|uniref:IclR family transcriptional regulator n=1 Tax=Pararhodobacter marinus TaxID=2184063 RepID=UPI003515A6D6
MKKADRDEDWSQRRIQSIEVGFQVIRAMEAADGPLPLRDVAANAGMPPSKVHLYLVSFIREGLVRQDPHTGHYGLGSFAIQLGHSAIRQLDIVGLSRDELNALQETTGFAAYLSVWGNRGPGIVSKVDGQRQGSLTVRLGYVLPLYASATGRIFLAYLNRSETEQLLAEELNAIRAGDETWPGAADLPEDPEAIDDQMQTIREQGYAISRNNINANFAAMAAPVFDHPGRIVAAITVLGSEKALTGARAKSISKLLLESTGRLSERMGNSPRERQKGDKRPVS